jgi:large conductance mechanosensitive channel
MSLNTEVSSVVKGSLGFVGEFKQFIARGNVVDLAVGVIIGGAFGNIVNSLVKDVVMPPIGLLTSGHDFSSIALVLQNAVTRPDPTDPTKFVVVKPEVVIALGAFLNTLVSFLIVSFVVFLIVKGVNALKRLEAEKPADPPVPSPEEKLLIEIRDLLAREKA